MKIISVLFAIGCWIFIEGVWCFIVEFLMLRIDKYIANLGLMSRKDVKPYMKKFSVLVNGEPALSPDQKISFGDTITFAEEEILVQEYVTILLHKPAGYVSSDIPEGGYPSYRELLSYCPYVNMLHVAGRLDQDTEGLLIASNDGQFIHRVITPKRKMPKVYYVELASPLSDDAIVLLQQGVTLDDGYETMESIVKKVDEKTIRLTIYEGKYHQVKRMLEAVGNKVVYLKRESIGEWTLGDLEKGEWRYMKD